MFICTLDLAFDTFGIQLTLVVLSSKQVSLKRERVENRDVAHGKASVPENSQKYRCNPYFLFL